jgi:hypothetical protein
MQIKIASDRSSTLLEFAEDNLKGSLKLSAEQLLSLMQALGRAHAEMLVGKPLPALEGQQIEAIYNTRWFIQQEAMTDGSSLSFYHPWFGPIGFVIPHDQVPQMVQLLTAHINAKAAKPPEKAN